MAWNIIHYTSTGKDLVAVIVNGDGEYWDGNSWEETEQRLALVETDGEYIYSVTGMADEGLVRVSILDEGDADNRVGGGEAYIVDGEEPALATQASVDAVNAVILNSTTIATLTSQTSFTLTAGSADNDAYNNRVVIFEDQSTAVQKAVGIVSDYVGSTKTVTLKSAPAFTIATGDTVRVLALADMGTIVVSPLSATSATDALTNYFLTVGQHTTKTWTLGVYSKVDGVDTAVDLSGKTVKVAVWRASAPTTIVATLSCTIGGDDNNEVTFSIAAATTGTAEVLKYTMQNTTDDEELLKGTITIDAKPNIP